MFFIRTLLLVSSLFIPIAPRSTCFCKTSVIRTLEDIQSGVIYTYKKGDKFFVPCIAVVVVSQDILLINVVPPVLKMLMLRLKSCCCCRSHQKRPKHCCCCNLTYTGCCAQCCCLSLGARQPTATEGCDAGRRRGGEEGVGIREKNSKNIFHIFVKSRRRKCGGEEVSFEQQQDQRL